ncbi:uncharacterized protein LOC135342939 isoform X3 [Halichondria panicea]|uniref:uncharacterized protein LOC135342939 isoform X3 n=1 Tax=Halichondria panicea TaxID=6063 RepID=UPI00312B498E
MAQRTVSSESIQIWLQLVDNHLTPESVAFLKLGLYPRIKFVSYEQILKPSQLYNYLLASHGSRPGDEKQILQVFANALKQLGEELRGVHLVDCMPAYGLDIPLPLKDHELTKDDKFYSCLVRVGIKSRGLELELRLQKHFCRPSYLNMNYQNLKHLPDLFVRLIQNKLIGCDYTEELLKAFTKYGARQCIKCLDQYYHSVDLPRVPTYQSDTCSSSRDQKTSGLNSSSEVLSECERKKLLQRKRKSRRRLQELSEFVDQPKGHSINNEEVSRSAPQNGSIFNEIITEASEATVTSNAQKQQQAPNDESNSSTDHESSDDEEIEHFLPKPARSIGFPTQGPRKAFCTKFCCVGAIVGLLMFLVVVGVVSGTAWIHLIKTKPMSTQGKEGNIIVLGRINHFFVRIVDVYGYRIIEPVGVYRYDGDCANLPANPSPQHIKHLKNITNMYLLEGTEFIYDLQLLDTNNNAHVDVYLTIGLEVYGFNPLDEENVVCHNKAFSDGKTHHCVHRVTESTYYNLNILLSFPIANTEYHMNVSFDNKSIITTHLEHICTIANKEHCVIPFSFSGSLACLVGNISNTTADDVFYVDVNTIAFQISPVLGITVTIVLLFLLVFLLFCCCCLYTRHNFCL